MFAPYTTVLKHPGAARFSATGVLARFEMAMGSLGVVLLVTGHGGSYSHATALTAAYALSNAVCWPVLARVADRRGQHVALAVQAWVHGPAILLLVLAVHRDVPIWGQAAVAAVAGGAHPSVTAMVRARWSAIFRGSERLRTAFALESTLDAALIAIGAPLATFLAAAIFPAATLLVAVSAACVSAALLAAQRATQPDVVRPAGRVHPGAGPLPGIATVALVFVFVGAYLGAFDVASIAVADMSGRTQTGGWILAAYATGSVTGGILVGRRGRLGTPSTQFMTVLGLLTVAAVPMLFAAGAPALVSLGFLAGFFVAPTLIVGMTVTASVAPAARVTEALAWTGSGMIVGRALGQLGAGAVIDGFGGTWGYAVCVAAAAAAFTVATLFGRAPARHPSTELVRLEA
ncbi:MFS transporter [Jiangella endophytica]|uniref:MFS transporter n=1 Tax=Jiangella endophytica TaxID=1623398 RepID=UPI000E347367|nr:MFS transporter [Jiangella endophytica]